MTNRGTDQYGASDRRGIALPLVLMLTVFLTISVGAGFIIAGNEHTVGVDHDAQLKAFAVAQEGVERYMTDVTALPSTFPNTQTISVTGGTATVTLRKMRDSASGYTAIYVLTSVGDATSNNLRRSASTPVAERSISQFVVWQSSTVNADAAWTALSGMQKNGNPGTISGVNAADATTSCPGGGGEIPGVAVPVDTMYNGNTNNVIGTPPIAYIGTPGPTGTAVDSVNIDWAGILGGSIAPDFTIKTTSPTSGSWPTAAQYNNWPVVLVKGNLGNGVNVNAGKGVLIVTGNADLTNFDWHGLVLVGGALTISGVQGVIYGSAISGLNIQLGQTVGPSSVGNGAMHVQYNSCDVAKALADFGGWRRVQNSWADNWPSYTVP